MNPKKDMFLSGCQVLVNPVNCVGAMGKGLAVQFRTRFPNMANTYRQDCRNKKYAPGNCYTFTENNTVIANLTTENHYKNGAKKSYIIASLQSLFHTMEDNHYQSVAIPRIGCGLGGLDWNEIRPIILDTLKNASFTIWLNGEIIKPKK